MEALAPKKIGDLIGQSLGLTIRNFAKLFTIYAMLLGPFLLVQFVLSIDAGVTDAIMLGVFGFLYFLVGPIPAAATGIAIAGELTGERTSVRECYRAAFSRARELIALGFLVACAMVVGTFLLVVPALYVWATFMAMAPVIVLEGRGISDTIARCRALAHGRRIPILLTTGAIMLIVWLPCALVGTLAGWILPEGFLTEIVEQVDYAVGSVFVGVAGMCIYLDLRVRRDGYRIEQLEEEVDVATRPRAANPAAPGAVQ